MGSILSSIRVFVSCLRWKYTHFNYNKEKNKFRRDNGYLDIIIQIQNMLIPNIIKRKELKISSYFLLGLKSFRLLDFR